MNQQTTHIAHDPKPLAAGDTVHYRNNWQPPPDNIHDGIILKILTIRHDNTRMVIIFCPENGREIWVPLENILNHINSDYRNMNRDYIYALHNLPVPNAEDPNLAARLDIADFDYYF